MTTFVHILNGDALLEQFPKILLGERLVVRECLMEGPANAPLPDDFYQMRANYLKSVHPGMGVVEYFTRTVPDLETIRQLPVNAQVILWFEDDLFCQVNFWFVCHLMNLRPHRREVYLVRPNEKNRYAFGGMTTDELQEAFLNRTPLRLGDQQVLQHLWKAFAIGDLPTMKRAALTIGSRIRAVKEAVAFYEASLPSAGFRGRPRETLLTIMKELQTQEFEPVFQEFRRREACYGYTDLQVKRFISELVDNR